MFYISILTIKITVYINQHNMTYPNNINKLLNSLKTVFFPEKNTRSPIKNHP